MIAVQRNVPVSVGAFSLRARTAPYPINGDAAEHPFQREAKTMPWLFLAATVLALLCLITTALDWWTNGFAAEWAPVGLLLMMIFALVAWVMHP